MKLKRSKVEFAKFEFDDGTAFELPLAGGLKAELNARLFDVSLIEDATQAEAETQRLILDVFREYNDPQAVSTLTFSEMMDMWRAWRAASSKAGQEPGE